MNLNQVFLAGNLVRDPELKKLPSGKSVCEFTVAVNNSWKDEQGNKKEDTGFFACNAWGRTAEVICEFLKKGNPIFVIGRLKTDSWEKDGVNQYKTKVSVTEFQFVGTAKSEPKPTAARTAPPKDKPDPDLDVQPDDVPF